MRMPGIEPGSQAWEACMMPLHYMRCDGAGDTLDTIFTSTIARIQHIFYVSGLAAELFFLLSRVLALIWAR